MIETRDPPPSREDSRPRRRLRALARLMDEAVEIPVVRVRVGLDAFLGLLPAWGDVAGAAISGWIVVWAARLGAPPSVLVRMILVLILDALAGALPLVGDLFDAGFRANRRNVDLLERYLDAPSETLRGSRRAVWATAAAVTAVLGALLLFLSWAIVRLWGLATPAS